jgi:hypothetical protein
VGDDDEARGGARAHLVEQAVEAVVGKTLNTGA